MTAGLPPRRGEWGATAGYILHLRALVAAEAGDRPRASDLLVQSLTIFRNLGLPSGISDALAGLAVVATDGGKFVEAARLLGGFAALDEVTGASFEMPERATYERALANIRRSLGEDGFVVAQETGRALSLADAVAEALAVAEAARVGDPVPIPTHGLTPRELEVLRLLAEGRTDREIGGALGTNPRTAMRHVANIYLKLDLSTRAAAADFARRHNLV